MVRYNAKQTASSVEGRQIRRRAMEAAYYVGLDLAKNIFQIFTADGKGLEIGNRKMGRKAMVEFFANLPQCSSGMEACGTASTGRGR
jgi:hypothetical protein